MDSEIKKEWVDALRSGKYEQCKGSLKTENGYCCLGVLCDVLGERWEKDSYGYYIKDSIQDFYYKDSCFNEYKCLPRKILNRSGINNCLQAALIRLNDIENSNFNQIADYIEKNL